jgi:DNA-binding MarR family transcriptional regulator
MIQTYLDVIRLIGQTRSSYGKAVRKELRDGGPSDISDVEAFILWNLATEKTTTNELRNNINWVGSNLNAIIRRLTQSGYVFAERSQRDRRVIEIWLSEKGRAVADRLTEMHHRVLGNAEIDAVLESAVRTLRGIEEFWTDQRHD